MLLGAMDVRFIHSGSLRLDGGAMFGVVPKTLWQKKMPADERNRCSFACNSLLIRASGKNIFVETGNGTKWDAKLRDIYAIESGDPLLVSLQNEGLAPENIDLVVNTHLHFDHAGGNTRFVNGRAVPAFPNARYVVQRAEIEHALHPTERDRASYFPENVTPISESGQWQPVEGNTEILPGVSVERIPGHNADIQAVKLAGGGQTIVFIADLIPSRHHLPLPWIMAYDLYPLQTLETKRKWIADIVRNNWIVVFGHDPEVPAAKLHDVDGKIEIEPVDLNQ
ncbi:MAG TPA: MBL fold metallo-hydrolase [Candidatus Acidoferrum sp.]|nr:MBL fold metallo-hydrolase [Candidatus Acidoferrum sp.]